MIEELSGSMGNIMAFEIRGKVSLDEEKMWLTRIDEAVKVHGKVRFLVVLHEDAGWGIRAGIEDIRWGMKHTENIERIAIVTDRRIWKWLAEVEEPMARRIGVEERRFSLEDLEEAWRWIRS